MRDSNPRMTFAICGFQDRSHTFGAIGETRRFCTGDRPRFRTVLQDSRTGQGNHPYRPLPEPPPDPRATWWEIALATALAVLGLGAAVWSASGGLP